MLSSRERVELSLNHKDPGHVPLDLGGSVVTGMHVSSVYKLRQALGLDPPGTPVKVTEPFQMLGEIGNDLKEVLGVDIVPLQSPKTMFGFKNERWRPWRLFDATPVLVPDGFNTDPEPNGDILMYPEGDRSASPSGRMPKDGYYFDAIVRQIPFEEDTLNPLDNTEEYTRLTPLELDYYEREANRLYAETDKAIFANFGGTSFGDIALVPAPFLKNPRGIRDVEEWYISLAARRKYLREIFEIQCDIAIENFKNLARIIGNKISVVFISGTDFGMQTGTFISPSLYRELFKPFHVSVNNCIHRLTGWKTFIHTCGSVKDLVPDFIEAGFDIMNPVQTSAEGMELSGLKKEFGGSIVFWGGGVDTQKTLPFGNPQEIRKEVKERLKIMKGKGGFIFNTVHNVQANIPAGNLTALYEAYREYN